MRSLRLSKAPNVPSRTKNRRVPSQTAREQTPDQLQQMGADTAWKAIVAPALSGLTPRASLGQVGVFRHLRGFATFSTGWGARVPGLRKDAALSLGKGWDGGGEDVAVAVWWDFENCSVPLGIEAYRVGVNIVSGLRMSGFKGPVSISAYGDTLQLSRTTQEALSSTGIQLHHIPSGGKDSSDRALLVDLILWTFEHPPPAHLFLISGDRDFSNALHRLRMMNYNILLACPAGGVVSPALLGAATHVWQWNCLVRGEGLLLEHSPPNNKPPDGTPGGAGASRQSSPRSSSSPSTSVGPRVPDVNVSQGDSGSKLNLPASPPRVSPPYSAPSRTSPCPSSTRPTSDLDIRTKAIEGNTGAHGGASQPVAAPLPSPSTSKAKKSEVKNVSPHESKSQARVPKEILVELQDVLVSHPDGIMFTDVQTHMLSKRFALEKDFFSPCKMVPLLSSIPDVVQLERVLMKDSKSWTYLLMPAQSKPRKSSAVIENKTSRKATTKQQMQSNVTSMDPELSLESVGTLSGPTEEGSLSAQSAIKGSQVQVDISNAKGSISSTLQEQETSAPVDCEASKGECPPDSVAATASAFDREAPTEGKTLGEKESHAVDEMGSYRGFFSFLSPLANMVSRKRREKVLNGKSNLSKEKKSSLSKEDKPSLPKDDGPSVNPSDENSIEPPCKKVVHAEDSSENSFQKASERATNGEKLETLISKDDMAEQSRKALVELADEEKSGRFWQRFKVWLFGRTKASDSSHGDSLNTSSSKVPAIFDLSDLDRVTWEELLSRPQKCMQNLGDKEAEARSTSNAGIMPISSSTTDKMKVHEEKGCSRAVLEDLNRYLRGSEGAALISEASSRMEAVNLLRTVGPHKFGRLEPSQLSDFFEKLDETGNGFHFNLVKASDVTLQRSSTEGDLVTFETQTAQVRQSMGKLKCVSDEQAVTTSEQNESNLPVVQPFIRSKVMDQLLRGTGTESPSSSTSNVLSLNQNGHIGSRENESELLKAPGVVDGSSGAPAISTASTVSRYPTLRQFQSWFLDRVKESQRCEKTRRLGYDLCLVKPEFERAFGVRLDPKIFGFVKLQDLVNSISEIVVARPRNDICVLRLLKDFEIPEDKQSGESNIWPQMYHDCKRLVRELMLENPDGLPGTKLKPLFIARFQYPLDHKRVGYQRMSDLLRVMPDVVSVSGKLLVPSQELLSTKQEVMQELSTSGQDLANSFNNGVLGNDQDSSIKTGFETLRNWSEIDVEGNVGAILDRDIGGNDAGDGRRMQHQLSSDARASKELSVSDQLVPQPATSPETESEEIATSLDRPSSSTVRDVSAMDEDQPESSETGDVRSRTSVLPTSENADLRMLVEPRVNVEKGFDSAVDENLVNAQCKPQIDLQLPESGRAREYDGSHLDVEVPKGKHPSVIDEARRLAASRQPAGLSSGSIIVSDVSGSKGEEDIVSVPGNTDKDQPRPRHSLDLMARENAGRDAVARLQGVPLDAVSPDMDYKREDRSSCVFEIGGRAEQEGETFKDSHVLEIEIGTERDRGTSKESDTNAAEDANLTEVHVPTTGTGDLQSNLEVMASASCNKELRGDLFTPNHSIKNLGETSFPNESRKLVDEDEDSAAELKAHMEEPHKKFPREPCTAGDVHRDFELSSKENAERLQVADENLNLSSQSSKCDVTPPSQTSSLSEEGETATLQAEAPVQSETAQSETAQSTIFSDSQQASRPPESVLSGDSEKAHTTAEQAHDGKRLSAESPSPTRTSHRSIWKRLFWWLKKDQTS